MDTEYSSSESSEEISSSSDENLEQSDNLKLTGQIIKNYNIICEIGRGAFSIVWFAYNITNNNFYALKVQDPNEYNDGYQEILFVQRLPKVPSVFNNIIEYFVEDVDNKKYLCSVWELHCSDMDSLIRKGDYYENGLPLKLAKNVMKQLIESVKILHTKFKVFHGDIKTDNILIKGLNDKDNFIIHKYREANFYQKYTDAINQFGLQKSQSLSTISQMKKEHKTKLRKKIHSEITEKILEEYSLSDVSKHSINSKYLEKLNISLADFGTHCGEDTHYESQFGTRYYQSPEIILMGKCSFPVDIWALGCTFYELLSGKLLFDPIKDSQNSRDYYHLCLINETCGEFPINFIRKTKYYKDFFDSNGKIKHYKRPLENRLIRKINELNLTSDEKKDFNNLLNQMLTIDCSKRIDIEKLSVHHFFR
jgi:serine/threonine-protein kinase SRPK3